MLLACDQPRSAVATREPADSVTVDKQADDRAIRGLEQRWREALTAKDSAAIGRFYTESGYYLPQGSDGYEGPEPVGARWLSELRGGLKLERAPKRIEIADAGDMAYEVGTYEVSWEEPKNRHGSEWVGEFSVEEFAAQAAAHYREAGFWEREVARRVQRFGNIAHVWSTYESRVGTPESEPMARDINSVQLWRRDGRWRIVSLLWHSERAAEPIPPEYLSRRETGSASGDAS